MTKYEDGPKSFIGIPSGDEISGASSQTKVVGLKVLNGVPLGVMSPPQIS